MLLSIWTNPLKSLMTKTLNNAAKFNEEIILNTKNWDKDRIATIDFVLVLQPPYCRNNMGLG